MLIPLGWPLAFTHARTLLVSTSTSVIFGGPLIFLLMILVFTFFLFLFIFFLLFFFLILLPLAKGAGSLIVAATTVLMSLFAFRVHPINLCDSFRLDWSDFLCFELVVDIKHDFSIIIHRKYID